MCGYGRVELNPREPLRSAAECCFLSIILLRCGDSLMDEAHGRLLTSARVFMPRYGFRCCNCTLTWFQFGKSLQSLACLAF